MICLAVLTTRCRFLRSTWVQFPNQLPRMLSIVPLQKVMRIGGERWEPSQDMETLLGFLHSGASVQGPGYVLCQVDTKEFGVLHKLQRGAVDVQQLVVPLCSPEVNNHLFGFVHIQEQVVDFAPGSCSTSSLYDDIHGLHILPWRRVGNHGNTLVTMEIYPSLPLFLENSVLQMSYIQIIYIHLLKNKVSIMCHTRILITRKQVCYRRNESVTWICICYHGNPSVTMEMCL